MTKTSVAVKKPGGVIEWREVGLGQSNHQLVEVQAGDQERRARGGQAPCPPERRAETKDDRHDGRAEGKVKFSSIGLLSGGATARVQRSRQAREGTNK